MPCFLTYVTMCLIAQHVKNYHQINDRTFHREEREKHRLCSVTRQEGELLPYFIIQLELIFLEPGTPVDK